MDKDIRLEELSDLVRKGIPINVTEAIEPVTSGNITEFTTEWIEPLEEFALPSLPQLSSQINEQVQQVNATAAEQFTRNLRQDTFEEVAKLTSAVDKVVNAVTDTLRPLYETTSEINARVTSIIRGVQVLISQPVIDAAGLAGQIQNLIQM